MNEDTRHIIQQINHVELENEHDDGDWKIVSRPIDLAGVQNIRDMGGIPTRDGRTIRPGMLARSANLHKATDADLEALDRLGVRTVIDLRTKQERSLEEDRLLPGWCYEALPVFDEMEELGKQLTGIVKDPGTFIAAIYPQMLESPDAIACWKACFNELLDGDVGLAGVTALRGCGAAAANHEQAEREHDEERQCFLGKPHGASFPVGNVSASMIRTPSARCLKSQKCCKTTYMQAGGGRR